MISSASDELEVPEEMYMTAMKDALFILKDRGIEIMSQEGTHVFFTVGLQNLAFILHSTNLFSDPSKHA
jgi:hypothetical protein